MREGGRMMCPSPPPRLGGQGARPLIDVPMAQRTLINVNFPAIPADRVKGIRVVRQGFHDYSRGSLVEGTDPRGRPYFWFGLQEIEHTLDHGTDLEAVEMAISRSPRCSSISPTTPPSAPGRAVRLMLIRRRPVRRTAAPAPLPPPAPAVKVPVWGDLGLRLGAALFADHDGGADPLVRPRGLVDHTTATSASSTWSISR
jgi:hypothetical protein